MRRLTAHRAVLGRAFAVLLGAAMLAAPASALPPLSQNTHINNSLVQARVADLLRRGCPDLDARIIKAFGEARKLKRYAKDQGYSDAQIDAFLTTPNGQQIANMMKYTAAGTAPQVGRFLEDFAESTQADELIIAHHSQDIDNRLRSAELTAGVMQGAGA